MLSIPHRIVKIPFIVSLIIVSLMSTAMLRPILAGLAQQEQERLIDKASWRTEPVKILKLKTRGKIIKLGEKFLANDDWLRGLTVSVQNVSDKPISRIELDLSFPRPEGPSEKIPTYGVRMWTLSCLRSICLLL